MIALVATVACKKDDAVIKTTSAGETNVSPPADSAAKRGHSLVRVVNAIPDGNSIVLKLGDGVLFDSVKAASVTDYREVDATMAKFTGMSIAPGSPVSDRNHMLLDGNRYTVVYMAEDVSKNIVRVMQDEIIPDSGKARIRVLHAAPGAPELDVSIAGAPEKIFTGVNFQSEAGYKDVEPGLTSLEIRAKGSPKVLLRVPKLDLKAATATTIVITGAKELSSFRFMDSLMTPAKP